MTTDNGWDEYKLLILNEMKTLHTKIDSLTNDVVRLREEVAGLNVKSGVWGLVAGMIPAGLIIAYMLIR